MFVPERLYVGACIGEICVSIFSVFFFFLRRLLLLLLCLSLFLYSTLYSLMEVGCG